MRCITDCASRAIMANKLIGYFCCRHCCTVGRPDNPNAIGTLQNCGFPFTSGGSIYYTCAVNHSTTPCEAFCLIRNSQYAVCTAQATGKLNRVQAI